MRSPLLLCVSFALCVPLGAQTFQFFPRGMQDMAGTQDGFEWDSPPFRLQVILDASEFPWGSGGTTLQGFKLRRCTGILAAMPPHTKTGWVDISTSGPTSGKAPASQFSGNHGPNPTRVIAANSGISYPSVPGLATNSVRIAQPLFDPQSGTAWSADFRFAVPFVVPATATNLVLDVVVATSTLNGNWPVDHEPVAQDRGALTLVGSPCPAPSAGSNLWQVGVGFNGFAEGGTWDMTLLTHRALTSSEAIAWVGLMEPNPLQVNATCWLYVQPTVALPITPANLSGADGIVPGNGSGFPIPRGLAGFEFGIQFAIADLAWPNGFGMSAGVKCQVGSGARRATDTVFAPSATATSGTILGHVPVIAFY